MYSRQVEERYRPDGSLLPPVGLHSITRCWGTAENSTLGIREGSMQVLSQGRGLHAVGVVGALGCWCDGNAGKGHAWYMEYSIVV